MKRDYSIPESAPRGIYFPKKKYHHEKLYTFDEVKDELPSPAVPGRKSWENCYWYAMQVLFRNTHTPEPGSTFVSNFVDAAFNDDVFLWDTCFMTMFCSLFDRWIPGISSLDNFYCRQFDDGEIPREMVRSTGEDFLPWVNAYDKPLYSYFHRDYGYRGLSKMKTPDWKDLYSPDLKRQPKKHPYLTLDNLNHPIAAWAEWESYLQTGNAERLQMVFEPLYHYYCALYDAIRHASGLYVTDWASMDNSPRNRYLGMGVDISSEMVLFAENLLDIMNERKRIGIPVPDDTERRTFLESTRDETAAAVRTYMWDGEDGFFYDVDDSLARAPVKTAAAFWTLISGIADEEQQKSLFRWLDDPGTFRRLHRVPVLAADEEGYCPDGGYWRGSVWAPMNKMIVTGLEKCGNDALAREIALNDLECIAKVFEKTGTIWENYPPDFMDQGKSDHPDMVGWSGMAPILFLIRYGIGLSADSRTGTVTWRLDPEMAGGNEIGCRHYAFSDVKADFYAVRDGEGIRVKASGSGVFSLQLISGRAKWRGKVDGERTLLIGRDGTVRS